jgi:hypothetical protein
MRGLLIGLLLLLGLTRCTPPPPRLEQAVDRDRAVGEQLLADMRATPVPANHKALMHAWFEDTRADLKDRTLMYRSYPYGSVVCGSVQARPPAGEAPEPRPFVVYFTRQGQVGAVHIYSAAQLATVRALEAASPTEALAYLGYVEYTLTRDCGFR